MTRKRLNAEQKINILETHISKSKIADTCREFDIHPNQFLQWKKTVLESGVMSLNGKNRTDGKAKEIERLRQELVKKDGVISSLAEENVCLKKQRGGI